jgi:hypothetical protein
MSITESTTTLKSSIDEYIARISEGHRMHRKIQCLLDVRGLLVINQVEGDYVEFGVYRGEMMYAASQVLGSRIRRFIGLDTFEGLPEPEGDDADVFVFEQPGFMASPRDLAMQMMAGTDTVLVQGDFRTSDVLAEYRRAAGPIAVAAIDCNWPSSVRAALQAVGPSLQAGSILFLDDYFVGTRERNFHDPILDDVAGTHGWVFREFMTYPPCSRAFLVEPGS